MIAISAPAPAPYSQSEAFVAVASRRPAKRKRPGPAAREALAELASVARNISFDISRSGKSPITPEYAQEIGRRLLEIVDRNRSIQPRDWDAVIDELS